MNLRRIWFFVEDKKVKIKKSKVKRCPKVEVSSPFGLFPFLLLTFYF